MAQQVEGWPLCLLAGSGSPFSITDSSSNFDIEGLSCVSRILELPRRSIRRTKTKVLQSRKSKKSNSTSWLICLCSRCSSNNLDIDQNISPPSLAQYLVVERKAANKYRKNQIPFICCPEEDEFALAHTITESNTLFVIGTIAPLGPSLQ